MNADDPLNELLSTTNAQEWARVFCGSFGGDEELMLVWFANAIETGRSAGWKQAKEDDGRFHVESERQLREWQDRAGAAEAEVDRLKRTHTAELD